MKQDSEKSFIPHIIAVIAFLVISFVYFSPVFDGKELMGHDVESWLGMSQEVRNYNETHDEPTLWTNSMFGGMPSYQISGGAGSIDSPVSWISKALSVFPEMVRILFLYLIGFYILLSVFRINPWLSIALSIGFAFGSYNLIILAAGHITKAVVIAYMAPLTGSILLAFRRNRWLGAILTAIFLGLAIAANHPQILYYTFIMMLFFGISELIFGIMQKQVKKLLVTLGILLVAAGVALGMNATTLLANKEYVDYTMRGKSNGLSETVDENSHQEGLSKDYITQWSYGIDETLTLLIPNYKGGGSAEKLSSTSNTANRLREQGAQNVESIMAQTPMPTYWGTQPFTSGPVYVGAIICFLFFAGLLLVDKKDKYWLLGATMLALLLAWGRNFMPFTEFFIDNVPMYNMFRTVSMTLVVVSFTMSLMAALAIKAIFDPTIDKKKKLKALYIGGGITGGITLIFTLFPSIAGDFKASSDAMLSNYGYPDYLVNTLQLDRRDMLRSDALRSLVFIVLSFGVLWFFVAKKWNAVYVFIALVVLFLCDMLPVAKRYLNDEHFKEKRPLTSYFSPSPADRFLLDNDKSYYRVLDLTVDVFNSSRPAYFHKLIGGYHAVKLRRYQELINVHIAREIQGVGTAFNAAQQANSLEPLFHTFAQSGVLNMLNMKYIIYNHEAQAIANPYANGNAWFVDSCKIAQTSDEEMLVLGSLNTKTTLVADKEFAALIPKQSARDTAACISLTSYAPNHLQYESSSKTDQIAVFSEVYYDAGWNAYIDGVQVPYFRADWLLRALPIKAGEHKIEFRFEPQVVKTGNTIVLFSSILLLLGIVVLIFVEYRKRKKTE
ncbi:MAG: YfhO family protein [Prevotellaceae bacterium]|jgi:hypothetical protein|nr:YfhO family protein [Prevotellaceae bacterium]